MFLWSWLIFWAGYLLAETVSWSNRWDGLGFGLRSTPLVLVTFGVLMPPLVMLTVAIWKWRNWPPEYRTLCAIYPALVFALMAAVTTLGNGAAPAGRFRKAYGSGLPEDAHELHVFFSRTGFWAAQDAFAFQTTPEAARALLAAHPFAPSTADLWAGSTRTAYLLQQTGGPGWPDPRTWTGLKAYTCADNPAPHHFELMTDTTMTKVFILVWSN